MHDQLGGGWVWLDTSRGVFCCGPQRPLCSGLGWDVSEDLPLNAELLHEDVMLRGSPPVKVDQPTIISTRTNTILAIGSAVWKKKSWASCFGERMELPDGATRFTVTFRPDQYGLRLYLVGYEWDYGAQAPSIFPAQALSIFHAHGMSLEGNMCEYKLVYPSYLSGKLSNSKAKRRRRKHLPPIYLFIPPFSTSTFWSFYPDGQMPLSGNLCRYLGLPVRLLTEDFAERSWTTSSYRHIRDYQIARGFDPTTTDFARHLGFPIYDIVDQPLPSQFEEIDDSDLYSSDETTDEETSEYDSDSVEEDPYLKQMLQPYLQPHDRTASFTPKAGAHRSIDQRFSAESAHLEEDVLFGDAQNPNNTSVANLTTGQCMGSQRDTRPAHPLHSGYEAANVDTTEYGPDGLDHGVLFEQMPQDYPQPR
ncbi:hypothetical protein V5O48_017324, partial [Marasmius crinis-equi]